MRKLFVYGDSFSSSHRPSSWSEMLSGLLNTELVNFAVDGGSSENAIAKFYESMQDDAIQDGDVIVMQLSTPGRLHLEFQRQHPGTAGTRSFSDVEWLDDLVHKEEGPNALYRWWKDNRKFIEWHIANSDVFVSVINHESYIHVMKNFAEANPKKTVILLQHSFQYVKFPMINLPSNFLMPDISLYEVSKAEHGGLSHHDWVRHTVSDRRNNHLSNPNLEILANALNDAIHEKDASKISYDIFEKNIFKQIKNQADLDHYVNLGYISPEVGQLV